MSAVGTLQTFISESAGVAFTLLPLLLLLVYFAIGIVGLDGAVVNGERRSRRERAAALGLTLTMLAAGVVTVQITAKGMTEASTMVARHCPAILEGIASGEIRYFPESVESSLSLHCGKNNLVAAGNTATATLTRKD